MPCAGYNSRRGLGNAYDLQKSSLVITHEDTGMVGNRTQQGAPAAINMADDVRAW